MNYKAFQHPFVLLTFPFLLIVFAFNQTYTQSNGAIGDVKYSALEPARFMALNDGWVLMDGGASKESDSLFKISKLHLVYKLPKLPDGRGIFIRGMNMGRPSIEGDPEGDSTVGRYQKDQFALHKHGGGSHIHAWSQSVTIDSWGGNVVMGGNKQNKATGTPMSNEIIAPEGGNETRPRNIVLYTYIKIN